MSVPEDDDCLHFYNVQNTGQSGTMTNITYFHHQTLTRNTYKKSMGCEIRPKDVARNAKCGQSGTAES